MQQFPHANNLVISGGNFSQTHYGGARDAGLHLLEHHIATDAIYDSAERFPPPKCHPGTRKRVINDIISWINEPAPEKQAMWLYGPAGAGKSAIAHTIAVLLQQVIEKSKYAASFFFAKDAVGRGDGNKLFCTLAYQIALHFPSFRSSLDTIMLENPTLPTKSIDVQLRYLVIEPLKRITDWPAHTPTVIIDGLDECSGSKQMQSLILSQISAALIEHNIPLRFLIVSRPEYWIADTFEIGCLSNVSGFLNLGENQDSYADIRKYLRAEFNRVLEENITLMTDIPRPWPPEHILGRFVSGASGQFIYASTVIKFIDSSEFCHPVAQLQLLLQPSPHQASAFSELDRLYATILSSYPRLETLKCVLTGIKLKLNENTIEVFLGVNREEIRLVMRAIRSLITIKWPSPLDMHKALEPTFGMVTQLYFSHLSFSEFLRERSRSGKYAFDTDPFRNQLIGAIFRLGCDIIQGHPDVEKIISYMGLSNFRETLNNFHFLLGWRSCDNLNFMVDTFKSFTGILQEVLDEMSFYMPYASHVLWFTTFVLRWLRSVKYRLWLMHRDEFTRHKPTFKWIQDNVTTARQHAVTHVLQALPKTLSTFAYLASHSSASSDDHFHTLYDISNTMKIGIDTILDDLVHMQSLAHLSPSFYSETGITHIERFFYEDLYSNSLTKDHMDQQLNFHWDNIRLDFASQVATRVWDTTSRPLQDLYIVVQFLDLGRVSDIKSAEYFQDPRNMKIYNLVICSPTWEKWGPEGYVDLVMGALIWLNRQLIGIGRDIIEQHSSTLLQATKMAAKRLFNFAWLPYFIGPYSNHWFESTHEKICRDHSREFSTRSEETYLAESLYRYRRDDRIDPYVIWKSIKVFNQHVIECKDGSVNPSDWYPHLSGFLLTILIKFLYDKAYGVESDWTEISATCFTPLIQCLPYALPNRHNLDTIRVIKYLDAKMDRRGRWRPPSGFCSLVMDLLKRYNRCHLSENDFHQLERWLLDLSTHESKRIVLDTYNKEISSAYEAYEDDYTTEEDDD